MRIGSWKRASPSAPMVKPAALTASPKPTSAVMQVGQPSTASIWISGTSGDTSALTSNPSAEPRLTSRGSMWVSATSRSRRLRASWLTMSDIG